MRLCSFKRNYLENSSLTGCPRFSANDWVQLRELLNKVCDLGFTLLVGCSGGAYELLFKDWFLRLNLVAGFQWSSSVVLHDSWYVSGNLYLNFTKRFDQCATKLQKDQKDKNHAFAKAEVQWV